MVDNIIRTFSIIFCSIYAFTKITDSYSKIKISKIKSICLLITLSLVSCILNYTVSNYAYFISLILFWIIVSYYTCQPQKCFIAVTLSFAINFGIYGLISFIISFSFIPFFPNNPAFPYIFLAFLSALLHVFTIHTLCKTKRLRNGMPFLSRHNALDFATFISVLLVLFIIYLSQNHNGFKIQGFALILIAFTLAFLIYWWQAQITKSYRRSLELRELESLRTADIEKDILIQKLFKENERLATITHRDNTLITTLKNSTVNYLMTDFEDPEEAKAVRDKLIANIESLSEGRTSLPPDYREKKARDFNTGISILDEMLHHMDEIAIEKNITFSVHLGTELVDFVPQNISESDLVHTVDDLLKNAFKSTLTCEKRAVQLQFYKLGKHFVVEVADNGIPFEVRSLVNMGIEKLTTYEDGSGIGLMDIWNTKEKYGATYHLEEYATPAPFSKKISLTFDKKNRYSIRTWRKDEILQMSKRADLQVYDYEE